MLPQQTIEQVKAVPITSYLQSRGIFPAHALKGINDYAYCSPLSQERTPSFFVNEKENVFNDFSTGQKGDVIRLVQQLEKINFVSAVRRLETFVGYAEPLRLADEQIPVVGEKMPDSRITAIRTLQHPSLIRYIESVRGVPLRYASAWIRQIHYTRKERRFFGVGFRTDIGSWAVRSEAFKTWIGPAEVTTIEVSGSTRINVFEGFFNYLSALAYYNTTSPRSTTIVLNSVSHLKRVLPVLQKASSVFCYLDNDRAGRSAVDTIRMTCNVVDRSGIYAEYNDLNEFICKDINRIV